MLTTDVACIRKASTGIEGFDEITGGGLPLGRTSIFMGGPGAGKTVLALQTLVNGARVAGERGIFVAFEENSRSIIANAASFGWDLPAEDRLLFLDAGMSPDVVQTGRFDVGALLSGIRTRFAENRATRIVFDSIDVLLALLDDPFTERQELYRIQEWLAANEVTGIITARAFGSNGTATPASSFLEYMADCVVHLGRYMENGLVHRTLQVTKYRGSSVHEGIFPLAIGNTGMMVSNPPPKNMAYPAYSERIATGVERLDAMLTGGYFRGSTVLLTGAPGTCKSTLAAAFAEAACKRGERCLFVSFDESASEIVRNLVSIQIDLAAQIEAGRLRIHAVRTASLNAEQHFMEIRALMDEFQPACLVIDPLSAVIKGATAETLLHVPLRMVYLTKSRGITMLCTSLVENSESPEGTGMNVSTIADSWLHLSYRVQCGERNRMLTIVKSRGAGHSRQTRELVLTNQGVTLADVYVSGGEALMGTLRWEREEAERSEKRRARRNMLRKAHQLALAEAEVKGRIEALNRELELRHAESEAAAEDIRLDIAQRDASTEEPGRPHGADRQRGPAKLDDTLGAVAAGSPAP